MPLLRLLPLLLACGARGGRLLEPEGAITALGRAMAAGGERAIGEALLDARAELARQGPAAQGALVKCCASILQSVSSVALQQEALWTLRGIAARADGETLQAIVVSCVHAPSLQRLSPLHFFRVFDAVALAEAADPAVLRALADATVDVLQRAPATRGRGRQRLLLDSATLLSRFAHRVVFDPEACRRVVSAAKYIVHVSDGAPDPSGVRLLTLRVVQSTLPLVDAEDIFVEVLGLVEACAAPEDPPLQAQASRMLDVVADNLGAAHLDRLVGVCAALQGAAGARRALGTIAGRLLEGLGRGEGLRLLVRAVAALGQAAEVSQSCARAVQVLHELGPPPEPPGYTALRRAAGRRATPSLSPELGAELEYLLPPSPDERDRAEIVEVCARNALGVVHTARAVLYASTLLPRRVGLSAARAFADIARSSGGKRLGMVVRPADFAEVGFRLRAGRWTAAGPAGDSDVLGGVGVVGAERVASELLEAVGPIAVGWHEGGRRGALRDLCFLAGGVHAACREAMVG